MDQSSSLPWSGQSQEEPLMPPNDDEFANLLDFGFQFPDLDSHGSDLFQGIPSAPADNGLVRMDTDVPHSNVPDSLSINDFNNEHAFPSGQIHPTYSNADIARGYYEEPSQHQRLSEESFQPQSHQASHKQTSGQHYGHAVIPPTPNSMELQGSAARYTHRLDESSEFCDRYARMIDEQAFYTPLISPAMTPLEGQFGLPEYTVPGEYLTPLTSPAIEAQNANSNGISHQRNQASDMGYLQSPLDNLPPPSSGPSSPAATRQQRRRSLTTTKVGGRAKKQSPSVRPLSRKKSLFSLNSDEVLNGLSQDHNSAQPRPHVDGGQGYSSNGSITNDSISPEPLSEPLMPPPALPPPKRSPAVGPQLSQGEAATPATLMRIQRSERSEGAHAQSVDQVRPVASGLHDDIMEDVMLPEPATPATHPHRAKRGRVGSVLDEYAGGPATSANGEPRSTAVTSSPANSRRTIAMPSPSGPTGKKAESSKSSTSSKKRQSLSSTQPSPQIRPKISPNIQPLMRGSDAISSETSAQYLAVKSNYQNILDGTHLPGVSYPEALAENLASKRTSHKLAEQGRRNRINNALKEIETLIPQDFINARNAKEVAERGTKGTDKEKEKAASQSVSKASAVEMAIDYIKALKAELAETKSKLALAESQLEKASSSN